jgi:hypothetical protein
MEFVNQLTPRQIQLLHSTMLKGDGDKDRLRFYQKKNQTLEIFQVLYVLCGYGTYLSKKTKELPDSDAIFSVSNLTKVNRGVKNFKREWVDFIGDIWCPNTETKTWLVRDNGFTYITGNSYTKKQVANMLALAENYQNLSITTPACVWASMDLTSTPEMP